MGELWTPNRGDRRGGLTIYVPGRHADRPACDWVCRVPKADGTMCGAEFDSEVSLVRHLRECVSRHEDVIQTSSLRKRVPALDDWDPEIRSHMRTVGKRMLKEGRWTVKPSERAGFS